MIVRQDSEWSLIPDPPLSAPVLVSDEELPDEMAAEASPFSANRDVVVETGGVSWRRKLPGR